MRDAISHYAGLLFIILVIPTVADEQDVLIVRDTADPARLVTGNVDVSVTPPGFALPNRVFVAELTEAFPGIDDLRGDEGFFAISDASELPQGYTTLDGGVDVRFNLLTFALGCRSANLWVWTDPVDTGDEGYADDVEFEPVEPPISLSYTKTPSSFFKATVDGSDEDISGFVIDRTSAAGGLHKHLSILLDDDDTSTSTPIPAGIYVVAMTVGHDPDGGGPMSDVFFEVFNAGLGRNGDAAASAAAAFFAELVRFGPMAGDLDGNRIVNLDDYAWFVDCTTGAKAGPVADNCACADFDRDDDVDLIDFGKIQGFF